jgi:Predicted membrane protein (DUF2339)
MIGTPARGGQGLVLQLMNRILHSASSLRRLDWRQTLAPIATRTKPILTGGEPKASKANSKSRSSAIGTRAVLASASRRPEQVLFFVATILLTLMLALQMRAGMVTVAWGIEGVLIILLALAAGERSFRLTGLLLLLACVGKIVARDAWGLAPRDRYVTFIILGMALLLVSFLYSKYRDAIRQFL